MKVKFEIQGSIGNQPIPQERESDVRFQKDDFVYHYNSERHIEYIVKKVTFVVDDCDDDFYQLVSISTEES